MLHDPLGGPHLYCFNLLGGIAVIARVFDDRASSPGSSAETPISLDDELLAPLAQHPRLRRLLQHVLNNLSEKLRSAEAAKIVNVETKYFSKFFRRETGFSFSWWNREVRIRRAAQLLRQKGRNVDSVALAVGYGDLTTFARAFKKSNGVPPRTYRRMPDAAQRIESPNLLTEDAAHKDDSRVASVVATNAK